MIDPSQIVKDSNAREKFAQEQRTFTSYGLGSINIFEEGSRTLKSLDKRFLECSIQFTGIGLGKRKVFVPRYWKKSMMHVLPTLLPAESRKATPIFDCVQGKPLHSQAISSFRWSCLRRQRYSPNKGWFYQRDRLNPVEKTLLSFPIQEFSWTRKNLFAFVLIWHV